MEIAMKRLLVVAALLALPLPAASQTTSPLVEQGRALFNDPKLSGNGQLSCATCHPMNGHTDNKTYVVAEVVADGDPKGRSTPTLWGAGIRQASRDRRSNALRCARDQNRCHDFSLPVHDVGSKYELTKQGVR